MADKKLQTFIVVNDGTNPELLILWDTLEVTVGRNPDRDVIIDDTEVSREHASFKREGNTYSVIDNRTGNGTFVNEQQVVNQELSDGDFVRVGQATFGFKQSFDNPMLSHGNAKYASQLKDFAVAGGGDEGGRTIMDLGDQDAVPGITGDGVDLRPSEEMEFQLDDLNADFQSTYPSRDLDLNPAGLEMGDLEMDDLEIPDEKTQAAPPKAAPAPQAAPTQAAQPAPAAQAPAPQPAPAQPAPQAAAPPAQPAEEWDDFGELELLDEEPPAAPPPQPAAPPAQAAQPPPQPAPAAKPAPAPQPAPQAAAPQAAPVAQPAPAQAAPAAPVVAPVAQIKEVSSEAVTHAQVASPPEEEPKVTLTEVQEKAKGIAFTVEVDGLSPELKRALGTLLGKPIEIPALKILLRTSKKS